MNKYRLEVKQIPDIIKTIDDLKAKVIQLEKDKVGELVKYHLAIVQWEDFRKNLIKSLKDMVNIYRELFKDKTSLDSILSLNSDSLIVGIDNFEKIKSIVNDFSSLIESTNTILITELNKKIEEIKIELNQWKTEETKIHQEIEKQKQELESKWIPFDTWKIHQITKDLGFYEGQYKKLLLVKRI